MDEPTERSTSAHDRRHGSETTYAIIGIVAPIGFAGAGLAAAGALGAFPGDGAGEFRAGRAGTAQRRGRRR